MSESLKIESDMEPYVEDGLQGKEHNQKYLAQQLKEPLVWEGNSYDIDNGIFYPGKQIDTLIWAYQPLPYLCKEHNKEEISKHVANHIFKMITKKENSWLTKIIKKIYILEECLYIETRYKTSFLDDILKDPSLSVEEIGGKKLGDYNLHIQNNGCWLIKNKKNIKYNFEIISKAASEAHIPTSENDIDIHWGIGTPSSYFEESDNLFSKEYYLPLHYYIKAGKNVDDFTWEILKKILSCTKVNSKSIVTSSNRLFDNCQKKYQERTDEKKSQPIEKLFLYYSNYEPNAEIAQKLASIFNGILIPRVVNYYDIVYNVESLQDGVILNITAPKHGGLLGRFSELYFLSTHGRENSDLFQTMLEFCLTNKIENISMKDILNIEDSINIACRQHLVGRLRPRFRSKFEIPITDIGMIKLSNIV